MSRSMRYIAECAIIGVVAGLILLACLRLYHKTREPCFPLRGDDVVECHYLESAVRDLEHPTAENKTVTEIECENYINKANRWLRLPIEGIRDKTRRYVEGCAVLRGGKL